MQWLGVKIELVSEPPGILSKKKMRTGNSGRGVRSRGTLSHLCVCFACYGSNGTFGAVEAGDLTKVSLDSVAAA